MIDARALVDIVADVYTTTTRIKVEPARVALPGRWDLVNTCKACGEWLPDVRARDVLFEDNLAGDVIRAIHDGLDQVLRDHKCGGGL